MKEPWYTVTMQAVVFNQIGKHDVLNYTTIETPKPKSDEALVKVLYCGINHLDILIRQGKRPGIPSFPHILGSEIAGVVETGAGEFQKGDHVVVYPWTFCGKCEECKNGNEQMCDKGGTFGRTRWGGYAEYIVVPQRNLIKISASAPLEEICAVTLAGTTAHHLIERANLKEKSTVLVTGATGGVGTALIQLLKQKVCTIIAATSDEKKKKQLKTLGVDHVVSTKTMVDEILQLFPQGINYTFDLVGGKVWSQALKTLGKNGTITFCATSLEENGEVEIGKTFAKQLNILGSYGGSKKDLEAVIKLVENGTLKPVIHQILPLEEAKKAHEIIEKQNVFGKVLLKIGE